MKPPAFGPFRIALIGDFSGRTNRGAIETGRAIAARRPVRVDRDSLDDAIARFAPRLEVNLGSVDERSEISFSSLDDFHPDSLYQRLPRFRALRDAGARALASSPLFAPQSSKPTPRLRPARSMRFLAMRRCRPAAPRWRRRPLVPRSTLLIAWILGVRPARGCATSRQHAGSVEAEIKARVDAAVTAELLATPASSRLIRVSRRHGARRFFSLGGSTRIRPSRSISSTSRARSWPPISSSNAVEGRRYSPFTRREAPSLRREATMGAARRPLHVRRR